MFGPILPIVEVEGIDAAIARINAQEKPLAVYLFCSDRAIQEYAEKVWNLVPVEVNGNR